MILAIEVTEYNLGSGEGSKSEGKDTGWNPKLKENQVKCRMGRGERGKKRGLEVTKMVRDRGSVERKWMSKKKKRGKGEAWYSIKYWVFSCNAAA